MVISNLARKDKDKVVVKLREIRARYKVSQKKLAELVGVSQPLIARIESGNLDPKLSLIKKIFKVLEEMEGRRVNAETIMNSPVKYVSPSDPIKKAVEVMMKDGISQMPVVDNDSIIGSITENAVVKAVMDRGAAAEKLKVKDVMEDPFPVVDPEESLNEISKLLLENQAVIVVDKGKLVGIITKHDVMKFLTLSITQQ